MQKDFTFSNMFALNFCERNKCVDSEQEQLRASGECWFQVPDSSSTGFSFSFYEKTISTACPDKLEAD
jgi:hypothetical protein